MYPPFRYHPPDRIPQEVSETNGTAVTPVIPVIRAGGALIRPPRNGLASASDEGKRPTNHVLPDAVVLVEAAQSGGDRGQALSEAAGEHA